MQAINFRKLIFLAKSEINGSQNGQSANDEYKPWHRIHIHEMKPSNFHSSKKNRHTIKNIQLLKKINKRT